MSASRMVRDGSMSGAIGTVSIYRGCVDGSSRDQHTGVENSWLACGLARWGQRLAYWMAWLPGYRWPAGVVEALPGLVRPARPFALSRLYHGRRMSFTKRHEAGSCGYA